MHETSQSGPQYCRMKEAHLHRSPFTRTAIYSILYGCDRSGSTNGMHGDRLSSVHACKCLYILTENTQKWTGIRNHICRIEQVILFHLKPSLMRDSHLNTEHSILLYFPIADKYIYLLRTCVSSERFVCK